MKAIEPFAGAGGLGVQSRGVAIRFHIFGHHTGASIALELACSAPSRVISATLKGLCSVTPEQGEWWIGKAGFPNPVEAGGGQVMRAWTRMAGLEPANIVYPAEIKHRDLVAFLKAGEDWSWGYRAVFRDNTPEKLNRVSRPIFFVIGRYDGAFPMHIIEVERHPEFPSFIHEDYGLFYAKNAPEDLASRLIPFMNEAAKG